MAEYVPYMRAKSNVDALKDFWVNAVSYRVRYVETLIHIACSLDNLQFYFQSKHDKASITNSGRQENLHP